MAFDQQAITRIVHMARADGIDPPALLAVAEVESTGRPMEPDGRTPRFLFERHVFYRVLYKLDRAKLQQAVAAGLAFAKRRAGQYRDLATPAGRFAVLRQARAIHEEAANQAASWGLGQILGENAQSLGYSNATAMVQEMVSGGVPAQVEAMLRFVRKNRLIDKLNLHDWAGFALRYNGPAYRTNHYDTKMAAAYVKWARQLDAMVVPAPEPALPPPDAVPEPMLPEPAPEDMQHIDELPPPYVEPKEPAKSKTLWSVVAQIFSTILAGGAYMLGDWRIMLPLLIVIVFLALFIGRERIIKIVEEHV
jgi:hypothetical protein